MRSARSLSLLLLLACNDGAFTRHNASPLVEILTPSSGDSVREASAVLFRGSVSDPDEGPAKLTSRWFVNGVPVCETAAPSADGTTECTLLVPSAAFTVVLEGWDSEGAGASAVMELEVIDDLPPEATITAPLAEGRYYSDRPVALAGRVSDPEDAATALDVRWVSSRDGELVGAATVAEDGALQGYANLSEGVHALQLFAVDAAGNEAVDDVLVTVGAPNTAPACAIVAPIDGSVGAVREIVELRGTVDDAELAPELLSIRWTSSLDGELGTDPATAAGSVALDTSTLSVGTHEILLTAADELAFDCDASITLTVDTPPTILIDAPLPGTVANPGDDVVFLGSVGDAEDPADTLVVAWISDIDGPLAEGTADSVGRSVFSISDLSVGDHTLTATVTDSAGLAAMASTSARINGLPDAPIVSLFPVDPRTDDDLVALIDLAATDPDGDPVTYTYAWFVDGIASAASSTDTLPASATTKGDRWTADVTATDGWGVGPTASASVTIGNTAPSFASVDITPDPATRSDTLSCAGTGYTDADGDADASTYSWELNGAAAGAGSTLSASLVAGDVATCAATPFDGADSGLVLYDSVTIQNSPPVVDSVTLSPGTVYTDDTLTVGVVSHDDEGDAITLSYEWTVGGVVVATSGTTLDGTQFSKHDVVAVSVTPSDADGPGTAVSASVTVSNTPPDAPSVAFDPVAPVDGDALLCEVSSASTDADGDTVAYTMTWTVDGAAYPSASDTPLSTVSWTDDEASGADTEALELYVCTVTPDDGEDLGATGAASVEIDNADTRVFVTSNDYNAAFGSLAGADVKCQDSADAAGLGGTWVAFLSDSSQSATSRIADGPYVLLDGTVIATTRADLLDGSLSAAIQIDEYGSSQSKWVFTGSTTAGTSAASGSAVNGLCADWTNGCGVCYGNHYYATVGRSYETGSNWTNVGWLFCSSASGLYCFEQ